MSRARSAEAGFTLLEVMVVLVIASLAVMVALPRFASLFEPSLAEQARQVERTLREARSRARATASIQEVDAAMLRAALGRGDGRVEGEQSVLFFPDGSASGGLFTLRSGSDSLLLSIDWLTGRVSAGHG
ncbi:prepilin-type N-terminal cleavage/methylation domain-containing protein [Geminicoccaceae bacterium 1502E]|nr:prepilin-type N-terminal cleavage/methylation domain-containing protein [Geminicoccaceae bacterium 1502E]